MKSYLNDYGNSVNMSEEDLNIRSIAFGFANDNLVHNAKEWDQFEMFPVDLIKRRNSFSIWEFEGINLILNDCLIRLNIICCKLESLYHTGKIK